MSYGRLRGCIGQAPAWAPGVKSGCIQTVNSLSRSAVYYCNPTDDLVRLFAPVFLPRSEFLEFKSHLNMFACVTD